MGPLACLSPFSVIVLDKVSYNFVLSVVILSVTSNLVPKKSLTHELNIWQHRLCDD